MSVAPIQIRVVREETVWRIQYGNVVSEFASQKEAMAAAIARAHKLSQDGQLVAVVMDAMTSIYGPKGFVRAIPTRRKSLALAPMPMDEYRSLVETPVEPPKTPAGPLPREKLLDLRSESGAKPTKLPRLMRIADSLVKEKR